MLEAKESQATGTRKRGRTGSRGETMDNSIIHLLHRASQRASEIFAIETRDFDLTARQYAVIATIARHEGLSQTDLVRMTGIDRSTLADVVQRLLRRGIIERERTTRDGRTYAVTLSEQGKALLQAIRPTARRADRHVLSVLSDEDAKALINALAQLIGRAEGQESASGNGGSRAD
jgi:DNA-binding MarR family transcriptional regulator